MTEAQLITILLGLVATFFTLIVLVLGWIGNRINAKLDIVATSMHNIETDLHSRISGLDRRVTVNETDITYLKGNRRG